MGYASELAGSVLADARLVEVGALVTVAAYSGRDVAPEEWGGVTIAPW